MHEMMELRNKLVEIDRGIIKSLKKRTVLEHQMAGYKKMKNYEEDLEKIHKELIEAHKDYAAELSVSERLVGDIFEKIYEDTRDIHSFLKGA